jgi:hypothetical protein
MDYKVFVGSILVMVFVCYGDLGRPLVVDQLARLASRWAFVWITAVAVVVSACDAASTFMGPQAVANGIEFQPRGAPAGVEPEPAIAIARAAVAGVDREFGVDISRQPDVLAYGVARCSETPSCLGAEAGTGPWNVWHIRWQPDASASWIALLLDPTTGESIWIGAG